MTIKGLYMKVELRKKQGEMQGMQRMAENMFLLNQLKLLNRHTLAIMLIVSPTNGKPTVPGGSGRLLDVSRVLFM